MARASRGLRGDAVAASWRDGGFQNNYDETITGIDQPREVSFDGQEYDAVLKDALRWCAVP
jgi:hypothetical protein